MALIGVGVAGPSFIRSTSGEAGLVLSLVECRVLVRERGCLGESRAQLVISVYA